MTRHMVDTTKWNRTNLLPGPEPGVLQSRQCYLRTPYFVGAGFVNVPFGGGYAIRPQQDDTVRFYHVYEDDGSIKLTGGSIDTQFVSTTGVEVGKGGVPEVVTWAKVDQYMFCTSPGFATHFGIPGAGMHQAVEEDVVAADGSTVYESLPVPRGICVEWAGRLVIAADDIVYFADTGTPFTFLPQNALDPPGGSVRGLHSVDGTLVLCTTQGVWALPAEAGMRENVFGQWQKVSDYRCLEYAQTVDFQGVVWGVSQRGITAVYPTGADVDVNQSDGQRWHGERMLSRNWRVEGRLISLAGQGVALVSTTRDVAFIFQPQFSSGTWFRSETAGLFKLRAALLDDNGEVVYLSSGIARAFRLIGNRSQLETTVNASLSGSTREHSVDASPVMRKVEVAADCAGDGEVFLAVKGKSLKSKTPPARGVVCGTSQWGDNTKLEELEVRSRQLHTSYRSDDHEIEVGTTEGGKHIRADIVVHFHGIGRHRPTN
jgi:hypothetical protein